MINKSSPRHCTILKIKFFMYKTLLKSIWTCGLQLWSKKKKSITYKHEAQIFYKRYYKRL